MDDQQRDVPQFKCPACPHAVQVHGPDGCTRCDCPGRNDAPQFDARALGPDDYVPRPAKDAWQALTRARQQAEASEVDALAEGVNTLTYAQAEVVVRWFLDRGWIIPPAEDGD